MKVQFLKNTATANLGEIPKDTILVYYEGYSLPQASGIEYIPFPKFKASYATLHFNKLIVVGLNRIITPPNRCDMVNDFLQTMTRNIPKMSIDTAPFIGEPWRLWYHYDVTNTGKFNVAHGYAIETEWKHWFYRDTNMCRLAGENIGAFLTDTKSDLEPLRSVILFDEPTEADLEWYFEVKAHIINKFDTPKSMIQSLLKECNKRFRVEVDLDFYRCNQKVTVPNLGVYRFVAEENQRRRDTYNAVIKHHSC